MGKQAIKTIFIVFLVTLLANGSCKKKKTNLWPVTGTDTKSPVTMANPPGGTHGSVVSVMLNSNEPSTIYYTTDGREPSVSDYDGSGPSSLSGIEISAYTTLKFFAVDKAGNKEAVKIQTYVISTGPDVTLPTTTAYPPGGTYTSAVSVTLVPDESATVYYTTDGSTPDAGSAVYGSPINIAASRTLKFFAVDAAGNEEGVKTEEYVIDPGADVIPPVTTADPAGGEYDSDVTVTLTSDEPATVYYTGDGRNPTESDYDGTGASPLSGIVVSSSMPLKFFGVDIAGNEESVRTEEYVINGGGEAPVISSITPDTGPCGTEVTIEGADFGATGTVTFHNGKEAQTTSWSDAVIVCVVPPDSEPGEVTVMTAAGTSNGVFFTVTADMDWVFVDSAAYNGAILAGNRVCIEFDHGSELLSIVEQGVSNLTAKAKQAVERAPAWVRAALVETLAGMSSGDQDSNANKILNASDPYVDEWAFIVANQVGGEPPLIDEIAQHLLYVQVMNYGTSTSDPNYYTTLKYALKDIATGEAVWIEIPKEIYYMQLVAHSGSNMRSLFFSANYRDPGIKDSVGKDAAYPAKFVCMSNWERDDGTNECAFRNAWYNNSVPTAISPCHIYPQPGVG